MRLFLKTMIIISFFFNGTFLIAQQDEPFSVVETMPEFPGGNEAMQKYFYENLIYPKVDRENGIEGKVIIEFTIEKDGSVANVNVTRGVSETIDAEAIRLVKGMPVWKPGTQKGKPVSVKYTMPLRFFFDENSTEVVPIKNVDFDNMSHLGWSFDLMIDGGKQFGGTPDYFKDPIGIGIGVNYHISRRLYGEYHSTIAGSRIQQTFNYQGTTWNKDRKSGFFLMDFNMGYAVVNTVKIRLAPYVGFGFIMHSPWKQIDTEQVKTPLSFSENVGILLDVKRKFRKIAVGEWSHEYIRFRLNFTPMKFKEGISGSMLRLGVGYGIFSNHQSN